MPAADAVNADLEGLDQPGPITVSGIALPIPSEHDGAPLQSRGHTTWRRLDRDSVTARLPYPVLGVYVVWDSTDQRASGGPARLWPVSLAPLDDGPHLNYAIQWFAFAVIGIVGGGSQY